MPKNNDNKMKGLPIRGNAGYQPLKEGYQPREKRGYTPTTTGSASNSPPKPPKGGTGQSSGKS